MHLIESEALQSTKMVLPQSRATSTWIRMLPLTAPLPPPLPLPFLALVAFMAFIGVTFVAFMVFFGAMAFITFMAFMAFSVLWLLEDAEIGWQFKLTIALEPVTTSKNPYVSYRETHM